MHLYEKGIQGFDVVDDGEGIPEREIEDKNYTRSMENRQRNEIYKTRSIGYKGEALDSLSRATDLTIITKEAAGSQAVAFKFSPLTRTIEAKSYHANVMKIGEQGTIIQVRNVHKHNCTYRKQFIKHNKNQYEQLTNILNAYSMVLNEVSFRYTNAPNAEDNIIDLSDSTSYPSL